LVPRSESAHDPPAACTDLGTVFGSGGGGAYTTAEQKLRGAQNELRNKTAKAGGNYVTMDVVGGDIAGLSISGRAFRCSISPATFVTAARRRFPRRNQPLRRPRSASPS
jgi:hypothetical protein